MSTRRARGALLAASLIAASAMLIAPAVVSAQDVAQDGAPKITLDSTGEKAGEPVTVRGSGWAGSDLVYLELCGNAGRSGSRGCDQLGAVLTGVGPEGTFGTVITVAEPPMPCPCVVKATSQNTQTFATAPLAVQGVPVVALENQSEMTRVDRTVAITEASLSGDGPWTSWFGGGAERMLSITLENTGEVAVHDPPLTVTAGKGSSPTGIVPAPRLGTIEPGDSVSIEVPVTFEAMSFGQLTAVVSVAGFAEPVEATAHTSTYPWGLIAIAVVLVQMLLLRLRNRTRDKIEQESVGPEQERLALGKVPAMAAIGPGPRALPPGQPVPRETEEELPPVPSELLLGAAIALPPREIEGSEEVDDDLVVVDLRDKPEPEQPVAEDTFERPASPHDALLPNPFDYVPDEAVAHAVEAASRPVDRRTPKDRLEAERRSAEASVQAAKIEAALIVTTATQQAVAVEAETAAKRAEAVSMIERSTQGVEELLQVAADKADEIRQQAERARRESVRAAAARLDAATQQTATKARGSNGHASAPVILDLRDTPRAPRETGTGGLASAIERAVHKAFKG